MSNQNRLCDERRCITIHGWIALFRVRPSGSTIALHGYRIAGKVEHVHVRLKHIRALEGGIPAVDVPAPGLAAGYCPDRSRTEDERQDWQGTDRNAQIAVRDKGEEPDMREQLEQLQPG